MTTGASSNEQSRIVHFRIDEHFSGWELTITVDALDMLPLRARTVTFYSPIYTPVKYRKTFITVSILCPHKYLVKPNALKVNVSDDEAELYNHIYTWYPYEHFCFLYSFTSNSYTFCF